ncbi:MAG TPA: hypothetical protein VFW87_00690 [Pirellulales bacterium]|nr:hypothetical protein [Pirellulales bacterium]
MHERISIEQRVALLEEEVAELKRELVASRTAQNSWLDEMVGSMKEFPEFKDVLKLGAEWRRAQGSHNDP